MPPESLLPSSEQTQKPILLAEQADFAMQKLGIPREKLDELTKNPEFQKDLKTLQDNPGNTTERGEFLKKYLPTVDKKDGGQILRKADGSIDFGEWLKGKTPEERKNMVKGLTRDEKESYGIYVENEGKQLDATISEKESACAKEAKNLYASLSSDGSSELKNRISSLQSNPNSPEYQELKSKGATDEQIKSGEMNSSLTALYTYNHHEEFITNGWVEKGKEADFKKTVDNFSDILGKDRRNLGDIPKFVESTLISGERKEIVLQGVDKLVTSGKYNLAQTTYNAESGYITFYGEKKGETTRIDTSQTPPRIEYVKSGLSIGKPIEKQEPTTEEKIRETGIQNANKNFAEQKNTTRTVLLQGGYQVLTDPTEDGKKFVERYQKFSFSDVLDPQKRVEMLGAIDAEKSRIQGLPEKMDNEALDGRQKGAKESIEKSLERIKETINTTAKNIDSLPKVPKSKEDTFESIANYNLNFLSKIGYDGIGQDNMERIIRTLNGSQNPSRSSVGEIDLNQKLDTPKTQALTLAIANLVRGGRQSAIPPTPEQVKQEKEQKTWDGVDKSDPYIAARQTQSLGFRESLLSVRRNMTQEGGSLKTRGQLDKALFGIEPAPEVNDSVINTERRTATTLA